MRLQKKKKKGEDLYFPVYQIVLKNSQITIKKTHPGKWRWTPPLRCHWDPIRYEHQDGRKAPQMHKKRLETKKEKLNYSSLTVTAQKTLHGFVGFHNTLRQCHFKCSETVLGTSARPLRARLRGVCLEPRLVRETRLSPARSRVRWVSTGNSKPTGTSRKKHSGVRAFGSFLGGMIRNRTLAKIIRTWTGQKKKKKG